MQLIPVEGEAVFRIYEERRILILKIALYFFYNSFLAINANFLACDVKLLIESVRRGRDTLRG